MHGPAIRCAVVSYLSQLPHLTSISFSRNKLSTAPLANMSVRDSVKHFFIWIVFIIDFSHHAFGNLLPKDVLFDSDYLADDALIFNDVETSKSLPTDLTPQDSDFSDSSWLTDSSTPPSDTTNLFADSSNLSLENSLFPEFTDGLLLSSCGGPDDGDFRPISKREGDNGVCSVPAPKTAADPPLNLKLPDLLNDFDKNPVGSGQQNPQITFPIPIMSGWTNEDDRDCRPPRRRLCCEGPLGSGQTRNIAGHCRGMKGCLFFFSWDGFGVYARILFIQGRTQKFLKNS